MKRIFKYFIIFIGLSCVYTYAEGDPDFVKLPKEFIKEYKLYSTINRDGKEELAKIYANETALSSIKNGTTTTPGSVIIMEVYKVKRNDKDLPLKNEDGTYIEDSLAAIAVMEKSDNWDSAFPKENRLENWGFAFYSPDGSAKSNDLPCVSCHTPLKNKDFIFSYDDLKKFTNTK